MKEFINKIFSKFKLKEASPVVEQVDRVPLSNEAITAEEAEASGEGVTYSTTENSEFARGAPKAPARGIDKFDDRPSV